MTKVYLRYCPFYYPYPRNEPKPIGLLAEIAKLEATQQSGTTSDPSTDVVDDDLHLEMTAKVTAAGSSPLHHQIDQHKIDSEPNAVSDAPTQSSHEARTRKMQQNNIA